MITITKIDELPERLANSKSSDSVGIGVGVEAAITLLLECILLSNSRNVLVAPPTRASSRIGAALVVEPSLTLIIGKFVCLSQVPFC